MKGTKKRLLIVLSFSVIALIVIAAAAMYGGRPPSVDREITGQVVISMEWLEIHLDPPLEPSRMEQLVEIYVEDTFTPYTPNDSSWGRTWGMLFPDGSIVTPEVQLVDEKANVYKLEAPSFVDKDTRRGDASEGMGFGASLKPPSGKDLPRDRVYPTVRIRSDRAINCSKVVWRCLDRK